MKNDSTPAPLAAQASLPSAKKTSVGRSLTLRVIAAVVLILFICGLGDIRRRRNAILYAEHYAAALSAQMGEARAIPSNLEPQALELGNEMTGRMEWLSREQVRCLRERPSRIMAARTLPLPQVLGANGRAAVFVEGGNVRVEWLSLKEFAAVRTEQEKMLRTCPSEFNTE